MEPSTPRLSTPPPSFGLLTPPSTGGLRKQEPFARSQETTRDNQRQTKSEERESLSKFIEDYKAVSDVEANHENEASPLPADDSSASSERECSTETISTSATSAAPGRVVFDKPTSSNPLTPTTIAVSPDELFPLLKLPISIRNKIYEHLLVIPAIICVRQKHTAFHDERKAFLYTERRELLPGIAYALAQVRVDGLKTRFSRFAGVNINVLRTSKEVFTEARAVMYSKNDFEIVKPTDELTPQPDFSIPLFPSGYQRLVTKLNIRIRTFYDLHWISSGGYNIIKNHYRGLSTLTLILEMGSVTKSFGRHWGRKKDEKWVAYIERLQDVVAYDLFDRVESRTKVIPTCLNLRVLFSGEAYDGSCGSFSDVIGIAMTDSMREEHAKREELRSALTETWELFKRGGK